jgi:hypothetical protein
MSKIVDINTNGINGSNLYITSKIFRDPVLAKDGYTYEREPIIKLIRERGTSPFTGEELHIDELEPDDRLQRLAEQHQNEQLQEKSEKIVNSPLSTTTPIDDNIYEEIRSAPKNSRTGLIIIICLLIFLIGLIIGVAVVGFQFYSAGI